MIGGIIAMARDNHRKIKILKLLGILRQKTDEQHPIEQAKIACAKKLFNDISTSRVKYHDVDSYQSLLMVMNKL
jgi:hypothetical protein